MSTTTPRARMRSTSASETPQGISSALEDRIRALGVRPETVDVSEFYKKGGGSVKCMIGDLGVVLPSSAPALE